MLGTYLLFFYPASFMNYLPVQRTSPENHAKVHHASVVVTQQRKKIWLMNLLTAYFCFIIFLIFHLSFGDNRLAPLSKLKSSLMLLLHWLNIEKTRSGQSCIKLHRYN